MLNFGPKQGPAPKLPFGSFLSSAVSLRCGRTALRVALGRPLNDEKRLTDAGFQIKVHSLSGQAGEIRQSIDFIFSRLQQRAA